MPTFKGQLGSKLDLDLGSVLVSSRWSLSKAAVGAEVALVCQTAYVGDGCPFEFTILDETGSKLDTVKAKSVANVCTTKWTIPDKAKGTLVFLAEASSVGLKGRSDGLVVMGRLRVGPVEAFDDKGAALAKATIGQKMRWKVKMPGIPAGTPAKWTVECHQDKAHVVVVSKGVSEVANGEVSVDWETSYPMDQGNKDHQHALDKTSETYEDAAFQATFSCLGVVAKSEKVPVKTEVTVKVLSQSKGKRTLVLPDGKKREAEFSPECEIQIDELPVGKSQMEADETDMLGNKA